MPKSRKPASLKVLDGDQPCRINRDEPRSPQGLGECPDWLDDHGRAAWTWLKSRVDEMKVSARADDGAALLYCQAYAIWRAACARVQAEGLTIETETTVKAHPCIAIANTAERQMLRILGRFGMTPADRAGLRVPEAPEDNPVLGYFRPKGAGDAKGRP